MTSILLPAFIRWMEAPFPEGGLDDLVSEAKADLAYWDYMVGDTVIPIMDGRWIPPSPVDIESGLRGFAERLDSLIRSAEGENRQKFQEFRSYCDLLIDVFTVAEAIRALRTPPRRGSGPKWPPDVYSVRTTGFLVGSLGVVLGVVLVTSTPVGWVVLASGVVGLVLAFGEPALRARQGDRLTIVICAGFLLVAAFLAREAGADAARRSTGGVIFDLVGAGAGLLVALRGFAYIWVKAAVARGDRSALASFLSRYLRLPMP